MKINRRLSKKKTLAVVISALIGIGTSSMAYSAKTDPATTEKGGSFTYITPAGGAISECASPYESFAITFINETEEYKPGHGFAMAYNIFYMVDDSRPYRGNYIRVENDRNVYPWEDKKYPDAEYAAANGNKNYVDWGAIGGFRTQNNNAFMPVRVGENSKMDAFGSFGEMFKRIYGTEAKVMTAYLPNGKADITGNSSKVTVRMPLRSYKRLYITGNPSYGAAVLNTPSSYYLDEQQDTVPGSSQLSFSFDFWAPEPGVGKGYLGEVIALTPTSGGIFDRYPGKGQSGGGTPWHPLKTFPDFSTIDLRTVDEIVITSRGSDFSKWDKTNPVYWKDLGKLDKVFENTDVEIKYLKHHFTGKNTTCN